MRISEGSDVAKKWAAILKKTFPASQTSVAKARQTSVAKAKVLRALSEDDCANVGEDVCLDLCTFGLGYKISCCGRTCKSIETTCDPCSVHSPLLRA